jgi:hypothetical protein
VFHTNFLAKRTYAPSTNHLYHYFSLKLVHCICAKTCVQPQCSIREMH